jgi:uncharacterized repeat protein (TIGR01451 family)
MKKLLLPFLFFLSLFSSTESRGQWVTIPDPNFVTFLQQNYPGCMNGNLMDTTCAGIVGDTNVNCPSRSIQNLYGIQYFDALLMLQCGFNQLTSLPALPASLLNLECNHNQLTSLPALPASLQTLYCYNTQLTSLPALPASLQTLDCKSNQLTSLPALPASLQTLYCNNNQLTSLPALPASLQTLYCQFNQLNSLPALPASLQHLWCEYNQLTSLPSLPASLQTLYCYGNQLTSLPALPASLQTLHCYENQLTSLPALPASLQFLLCYNNQLTSLPALPDSLQILHCSNNQLTSLPALPASLQLLWCHYNQLTPLPALPASLYYLNCYNTQLTSLPALPASLQELYCGYNQLTSLPALPASLRYLYCNNNQITCFPNLPNSLTDPGYFDISNNPFTCLPNYVPAMNGTAYLNYPLCTVADSLGNPNGCASFKGVEGFAFKDDNTNCIFDSSDAGIKSIPLQLYDGNNNLLSTFYSLNNGVFNWNVDTGIYTVVLDTANKPYTGTCIIDSTVVLDSINPLAMNVNFAIGCKPGFDVGTKSVSSSGWVFPGLQHRINIEAGDLMQWYNLNCAAGISGTVTVSVVGPVSFSGIPAGYLIPNAISGNVFTYNIADYGTLPLNSFALWFTTDTTAQTEDQVCVVVDVTPTIGDNDTTNNHYVFCYQVVNSYDPNAKEVYPASVLPGYDDYFTYTIHFQNTGNAPAQNIRLLDTLSSNLDLNTFEIIGYSHANTTTLTGNILTVRFPNIQLPDSTSDYDGSQGYFQYRIKPFSNLPFGTTIDNTCYNYFDYNAPIATNTATSSFNSVVGISTADQNLVSVYPNPSSGIFNIQFTDALPKTMEVMSMDGKTVLRSSLHTMATTINLSNQASGIYLLRVVSTHGVSNLKLVVK